MQQINFSVKTSPSGNLQGKKYIIGAECVQKCLYGKSIMCLKYMNKITLESGPYKYLFKSKVYKIAITAMYSELHFLVMGKLFLWSESEKIPSGLIYFSNSEKGRLVIGTVLSVKGSIVQVLLRF